MIRTILALVGILLIAFFGKTGRTLGFYCLLPAIVTIVWKISCKIYAWYKHRKYWITIETGRKAAFDAEEQKRQENLQQQKALVEKYKNSPITAEILKCICGPSTADCPPTQIIIYNNRIQGKTGQTITTYNFAQHRVQSLENVWGHVNKIEDLKYVVRPQIALAEAINALLSNQYKIFDGDNISYRQCEHSDGDVSTYISYSSDHVTMVLKRTLPNRSF